MYKLFIPSAGLGTRVRFHSKFQNKALITLGGKPAIAHIIDSTPSDVEVVVALGHGADYVKQTVDAIYKGIRRITYVNVDVYEGPGSGLGRTLACAKEHLMCPFIFSSNDTVLPGMDFSELYDPNAIGNWVLYCDRAGDNSEYRTMDIQNGKMVALNPKGGVSPHVYVGVAGIKDWKTFWKGMDDTASVEVGESHGLKWLSGVTALCVKSWFDVGNPTSLKEAKNAFTNDHNVLEKESEAIWFSADRVIKFSVDKKFISDRVDRSKFLPKEMMPRIINASDNVYSYDKVNGEVFSKHLNRRSFKLLFDTMKENVWSVRPNETVAKSMQGACYDFYKKKTYERVAEFQRVFEEHDKPVIINGVNVPTVKEALDNLNWAALCESPIIAHFHGDFHNENILVTPTGKFVLLDWRQNFSGDNLEFGDVYYDLAKFLHGLIVSHSSIASGDYSINTGQNSVAIDVKTTFSMNEVRDEFDWWLTRNNYDSRRVYTLCALVFLNIAVLHEYPYSIFLYNLGRYMLETYGK